MSDPTTMTNATAPAHTNAIASSHTITTSGMSFYQGSSLPPEIVQMIFKNLPLQSLVQCTLANREFCRIASPLVWVVHYDPQTKRNPLGPQYRQSLAKNAHQIESLTIRSEDSLDFFCPPPPPQPQSQPQPNTIDLPRLQELELLVVFRECNQRVQPDYPRILRCIETSLSTIHTLHIGNLLPAEHAIRIAHSQQLHLKDLSLRTKLTVNEAIFFLRELPSHVQSLNLNTISGFRQQLTAEERAPFTTKHDALRSLELRSSCSIKDFDRFLVPFLGTCSTNLKSFRVDNPNPLSNVHVQAALDKLGVEAAEMFTHEDLTSPEAEDEEIADTIHTFSNLEMVIIPDFKKVGQKTVETILALPDMLRVLELPDYGCIRSTDVVLMLSSLKHLERFTVRNPSTVPSLLTTPRLASRTPHPLRDRADSRIRRNSRPPCNIFLSAADVVSITWATKSLGVFSCSIQVPRLASDVPQEHRVADLTCEEEEECWSTQKQVLRRLSEQKNLTSLDLSITIDGVTSVQQWYSLELTQDSGLADLEQLTKLERLVMSGLNHRMGQRDFDWLKDTWNVPQFRLKRH